MTYWNWKTGGLILGLTFFLAVLLVKPIGVSTQFVIIDGIIAHSFNPELIEANPGGEIRSSNAYLNKSGGKYAKAVIKPLSYGLIFVLSMVFGGFLGSLGSKQPGETENGGPPFGGSALKRNLMAFFGGVIVLWGARLAGGCTSGHMMSGIMQTSLSGYFFAASVFLAAVPTAMIIHGGKRGER